MAVPVRYLMGGPDSKRRPEHMWIQLSQTGTTERHGSPSRHHRPRSWARPGRWLGRCARLYLVSIRPPGSPKKGPIKIKRVKEALLKNTRHWKKIRRARNTNAEPRKNTRQQIILVHIKQHMMASLHFGSSRAWSHHGSEKKRLCSRAFNVLEPVQYRSLSSVEVSVTIIMCGVTLSVIVIRSATTGQCRLFLWF